MKQEEYQSLSLPSATHTVIRFLYMNWNNLKQSRCPKCGYYLSRDTLYTCKMCNFRISIGKVFDIVGKPLDLEKEATKLLRK